jgi:hypothetical protein
MGRRHLGRVPLQRLLLAELGNQAVNSPFVALRLLRREVPVTLGEFFPQAGSIRP